MRWLTQSKEGASICILLFFPPVQKVKRIKILNNNEVYPPGLFIKSCTALEGVVQSAHPPEECRSGGTGRRKGLKIPRA